MGTALLLQDNAIQKIKTGRKKAKMDKKFGLYGKKPVL
jgi:hypothetical protein